MNATTMGPTEKQKKVLEAIKSFHKENGFMPTVRDLGESLNIKNPNGVQCHLIALEKKGQIKRGGSGRCRTIVIVNDDKEKALVILKMLKKSMASYDDESIVHSSWMSSIDDALSLLGGN